MAYRFSEKVAALQPSAIREILKFTSMPGVISFAAGSPAPEAFPKEEVNKISAEIFTKEPVTALQYNITEGYPALRETLKARLKKQGIFDENRDELIITSGAQQANELSAKVMCDTGDTLICEAPSFIGSLNAFRSYGVNLVGVDMEEDGIKIDELEKTIKENKNTKLLYLIPNFQNPTGRCLSLEKRKAVYELAKKYDVVILEDNPYGYLRFRGEHIPAIKTLDTDARVIYSGTFSKILAPGIRVGYVCGPKEIVNKIIVCKQVSDVHTNIWAQIVCDKYMKEYDMDKHIDELCSIYDRKCSLMLNLLDEHGSDKVKYTRPEGGFFIWATLPDGSDMPAFCKKAVSEYKVAVVPGNAFTINESDKTNSFRLNFSTPDDDKIIKGCEILGKMTKELFD